jgi:hypothetical protein
MSLRVYRGGKNVLVPLVCFGAFLYVVPPRKYEAVEGEVL